MAGWLRFRSNELYFQIEVRLLLRGQFQRYPARRSDAFEHSKRVPRVFRILQPGNPSQKSGRRRRSVFSCQTCGHGVTLHIPDEIAKRLSAAGADVSRRALEAIALEGYREQALTLYQVSELLGLSRVETEDFLGRHHVPLAAISEADLDREAALFEAASRRPR
jgi:predicted HTH domain antitoxin